MSGRLVVSREVDEHGCRIVVIRDDEGEPIVELTPGGALWLAQHLLRHGRIALREAQP